MTQIKTAVVTGGSRGIGRATVMALFEEGWNVVINYRSSQKEAEELAALLNCRKVRNRAVSVQADVSDLKQVEALFAQVDEQCRNCPTRTVYRCNRAAMARDGRGSFGWCILL